MSADLPEAIQLAADDPGTGRKTVGQILRAAREAAGLARADVSQVLKFSVRQIEQLEADDYASLPGAIIVRGFTRSYAKLLKLDPEPLLKMLDELAPNAPADVRPPENMGLANDSTGLRASWPLASVAIVLILAALMLALSHFFTPQTRNPGTTPPAQAGQENAPPAPAAPTLAAPDSPMADQPASAEQSAAAEAGAQPQSEAVQSTLVFSLQDRSWIEVIDGRQQVLHRAEKPAGSQLTLSGKPPFEIVVGNAGMVRLTYGDREIDLKPHTRGDVARLKLE